MMNRTEFNKSLNNVKKDIAIILSISFASAALYIALGGMIMDYGRDLSHSLLLRFLPVFLIQFGMSCLGVVIVLWKNKEKLSAHGLVRKNLLQSLGGCLVAALPTVAFLVAVSDIHGFLPFQGMFLTKEILHAPFPFNIMGYLLIALTWGLGEGLFYVVLAELGWICYLYVKLWRHLYLCMVL